jgi:hypothetical protein
LLPPDEVADRDISDGDDSESTDFPVIDVATAPIARTGSKIIRRNSGRFGALDADSVFRSDSVRRSSGTMQVLSILHDMLFFSMLLLRMVVVAAALRV